MGLDAVYHVTITDSESVQATVIIRDKTIRVEDGLGGVADCAVTADSAAWLGTLRKVEEHRLSNHPAIGSGTGRNTSAESVRPLLPKVTMNL